MTAGTAPPGAPEALPAATEWPPGPAARGGARAPVLALPRLHVPDEPAGRRERWRRAVLEGAPLEEVVGGPDGIAAWLWTRWSALAAAGLGPARFFELATAYRRELWLWLMGDRTWAQCCAGLIGRVERRSAR